MLNLFLVCTSNIYYKNTIFNLDSPLNRDNYWYPNYLLKEICFKSNIFLNTYDYLNRKICKNFELLFFDIPRHFNKYIKMYPGINKYLVIWECPAIQPRNWDVRNHNYFKKIFTWNDDYIDSKKYIKIYWPNRLPDNPEFELKRDKFCCLIGGNKSAKHPLELYSERVRAIIFFSKTNDVDLYGFDWDKPPLFPYWFHKNIIKKVYKGPVEDKYKKLSEYNFALVFENCAMPGYITEKIFDCFFVGTVPIYLGAPDIQKYIPKKCFIDMRSFKNYSELRKFLKSLTRSDIQTYKENARKFLESEKYKPFTKEHFAEIFVKACIG